MIGLPYYNSGPPLELNLPLEHTLLAATYRFAVVSFETIDPCYTLDVQTCVKYLFMGQRYLQLINFVTMESFYQVSVLVSDINDNTPILQSDFIDLTLSESIPIGTPVLNLVATDNDFGINGLVNYTIIREESAATGIITEGYHF